MIGLDEALGHPISAEEVITAFERALTDELHATLTSADYTPAELADAERIERERFLPFAE